MGPPTPQLLSFRLLPKGSTDELSQSLTNRDSFSEKHDLEKQVRHFSGHHPEHKCPIPNTGQTAFMELPGQSWLHPSFTSMVTVDSAPALEQF